MRTHGTLVKWNDERGFGFVAIASGAEEIFVHASAFPRDGQRPQVGEMVSFDVQSGADGKRKALRLQRPSGPSVAANASRKPRREADFNPGATVRGLIVAAALVAIAGYGYSKWSTPQPYVDPPAALSSPSRSIATQDAFTCDGRTHCSQMRSCAEAEYFLQNCPGTELDGNGDGEPCEQQHCN